MKKSVWFVLVLLVVAFGCQEREAAFRAISPTARPFRTYLGFTPFPYDISSEAVADVYARIATDANLIAHHFDNGVPWPEALADKPYSQNIQNDWAFRRANTPPGHKVYVAITPIAILRNGLAPYRGEQDDMPLPPPWDTYSFDHPDVKAAFLNYAVDVVEFFEPNYLGIGIESNLLVTNKPELWPSYLNLHKYVYSQLKARYPELPVFASLLGTAVMEGFRSEDDPAAQRAAFDEIMPYNDYFALSLYPYLTALLANEVPETLWEQLFSLSEKPIAITETGFPAEPFALEDGAIRIEGTPQKQLDYIERLLQEADERRFVFVVNFVLRDYDQLYEKLPAEMRELGILWRDTGLYDGEGDPRPALAAWLERLGK